MPIGPEQPETADGPNVIEDEPTNELANENTDGTETNENEEEPTNENADSTLDDGDKHNSGRSNRERRTVDRLTYESLGQTHQQSHVDENLEQCHNITTSDIRQHKNIEYNGDKADIIARVMLQIQEQTQLHGAKFAQRHSSNFEAYTEQYAQQYVFEKGLKLFKEWGEKAAHVEMDQLHWRTCFTPVAVSDLTEE